MLKEFWYSLKLIIATCIILFITGVVAMIIIRALMFIGNYIFSL